MVRFLTLWVALVVACDEAGAPPDEATTEALCTELCTHRVACVDRDSMPNCLGACLPSAAILRADALTAYVACATAQACTADEDQCAATCVPTDEHLAYEARCRVAMAACAWPPSYADAQCEVTPQADGSLGDVCALTSGLMDALGTCAERVGCDPAALEACRNTAYAGYVDR